MSLLFTFLACILAGSTVTIVPGTSAAANVSLTTRPASITTNGPCPKGRVTFTCTANDLASSSIRWFLNGDQITSYSITPGDSYPINLPVSNTLNASVGLMVEVVRGQTDSQGDVSFVNTTLTLNLTYVIGSRATISCGSFKAVNTSTINCAPPQASFIASPSNSTCTVQGSTMFLCQPAQTVSAVSWEVSNTAVNYTTQASGGGMSQLLVSGCVEEWEGTVVRCVLHTTAGQVYSRPAYLTVTGSNDAMAFFKDNTREIIAFIVGIIASILLGCSGIFLCYCCCHICIHRTKRKKFVHFQELEEVTEVEVPSLSGLILSSTDSSTRQRNEQRLQQELWEKEMALKLLEDSFGNVDPKALKECGSRLQKYWFNVMTSIALVSSASSLDLKDKQEAINMFLKGLKHPYLQRICSIKHVAFMEEGSQREKEFVIVTQPVRGVSLRDLIHGVTDPTIDWADKYGEDTGTALPPEKVAMFGRQILQAMLYLYEQKFEEILLNPLGHVQSGNIFVEGDVCRLGGYENKLLGYRTTRYRSIAESGSLNDMDVIMFGHLIYEMCTGREVQTLLPSEEDYTAIEEGQCRDVLHYIFKKKERKSVFKHSIQEISNHQFFKENSKEVEGGRSKAAAAVGAVTSAITGKLHKGKYAFKKSPEKSPEQQKKTQYVLFQGEDGGDQLVIN